jgi:hypothetical protein
MSSDDDLWRPPEPSAAEDAPASDETQPITGTPGSDPPAASTPPSGPALPPTAPQGPGAVPPPYNPYAAGYSTPGPQPGQGYTPPPTPYGHPQEYAQPQSPYGAPYQPAYAGGMVPDHPSATTSLVLGIIGLVGVVLCGGLTLVLSPAAWVVGAKAVREIDAAPGRFGGRDRAQTGKILGIIGTVLLALGVLAIIAFLVFAVAVGGSSSPQPTFQQGGA